MTTQNLDYYRQRADEELAAAERAINPSIAQIHLEMAHRYRDMLSSDADPALGDAIMTDPKGGAIAEPRAAFG